MNQDPYNLQRQECIEKNGEHTKVKGHNTCCSDDNVSVNHPEQKKTQRERWIEEIDANWEAIINHDCHWKCDKRGTDNCGARYVKILELEKLLAKDHEEKGRFIGRTPTGTFSDDKCNCAEITCKVDCKEKHTHKTFSCEKCKPKVSLLNKIKKLWKTL